MMYNIGDKVRIVNYGHGMFIPDSWTPKTKMPLIKKEENGGFYDFSPHMVGLEAIIRTVSDGSYAITTKEYGDSAWYSEDQLELINANPNHL